MMTEGTNWVVLIISAFWSSSRWPLATKMSSRRQRSIPLGGRYRQVSLYSYWLAGGCAASKSDDRFEIYMDFKIDFLVARAPVR